MKTIKSERTQVAVRNKVYEEINKAVSIFDNYDVVKIDSVDYRQISVVADDGFITSHCLKKAVKVFERFMSAYGSPYFWGVSVQDGERVALEFMIGRTIA